MLMLRGQVLNVGDVPVLAEEVRRGHERPRRLRVELVRREREHHTSPVRVGCAMSDVVPGPFGM